MKLKKDFITHDVDNEQIMVSASTDKDAFHGMVKSNETAKFIINLLKEDITFEDLLTKFLDEYDATEDQAKGAIQYVINELNKINALE